MAIKAKSIKFISSSFSLVTPFNSSLYTEYLLSKHTDMHHNKVMTLVSKILLIINTLYETDKQAGIRVNTDRHTGRFQNHDDHHNKRVAQVTILLPQPAMLG